MLLKWNARNWSQFTEVDEHDILFVDKETRVMWRGCSSGCINNDNDIRFQLVSKFYFPHPLAYKIDVRCSYYCQRHKYARTAISRKTIPNQLQCKFIISLEGNDVASGLKWMVYSNSCVLVPAPTITSWFMEDRLVLYFYYVPIRSDLTDLVNQVNWCFQNLDLCVQIAKNATKYTRTFVDEENERVLMHQVLSAYSALVTFELNTVPNGDSCADKVSRGE